MPQPSDAVPDPDGTVAPRALAVLGAAAGMGRWLGDHLLPLVAWRRVVLLDTPTSADALEGAGEAFEGEVVRATVDTTVGTAAAAGAADIALDDPDLDVWIAVPSHAIDEVGTWLAAHVAPGTRVYVVAATQQAVLERMASLLPGTTVVGVHPLFDASAPTIDGQTLAVVPSRIADSEPATLWLTDAILAAGGVVKLLDPAAHDATMAYVQTLTHQTLLAFADAVVSSGRPLEEMWELRTPMFESLLGLATRALAPNRTAEIAEIQSSLDGAAIARELGAAVARLGTVLDGPAPEDGVATHIQRTRDPFAGALFDAAHASASVAVSASQAKRSALARCRREGMLVGIRTLARPDVVRVGRVTAVSSVEVTLRELLVGKRGHASLLDESGSGKASRVGIAGKAKLTTFRLSHIDIVTGLELDAELDDWLAFVRRDVRFLVPESVSGSGVLWSVAHVPGIRDASLESEVVRTGQRSVVVRVWIRSDHDPDDVIEQLRARVSATYLWPRGVARRVRHTAPVSYLGPAGTFSEVAARHAQESSGLAGAERIPCNGFHEVLAGVRHGGIAVLPIASSASGLVSRAVNALLDFDGELVAGGVVDVAVRFDAYIRSDRQLSELRGARVYSHPQALAQCSSFIRRLGLEPVPCSSTAEGLGIVATDDPAGIAIAGAELTTDDRLKVAEREIDDLSGSITRFLVLGAPDAFAELDAGSEPTLRSLWVGRDITDPLDTAAGHGAGFDETLVAADGCVLRVSSRVDGAVAATGMRHLGTVPWSPRTPVVRVDVDVRG